jgi:FkbM family methyltransferase
MSGILRNLKSILSCSLGTGYFYRTESYSQEGEDLLINKLLPQNNGFYVDVGAHHPYRYSNTYLLYKREWRGINIEPNRRAITLFKTARPEDINLAVAIGKENEKSTFYLFKDTALNTFNKENADAVIKSHQSKLINKENFILNPLSEILNKYAKNKKIDFLNIDVEGLEMEVLESNDWKLFKPSVIAVEVLSEYSMKQLESEKVIRYIETKNYNFRARTINTLIFNRKQT